MRNRNCILSAADAPSFEVPSCAGVQPEGFRDPNPPALAVAIYVEPEVPATGRAMSVCRGTWADQMPEWQLISVSLGVIGGLFRFQPRGLADLSGV